MASAASTALGWVGILIAVAGIVVSAMHFGRVRGAGVLAAGFGMETVAGIFFRLILPVLTSGSRDRLEAVILVGSILNLCGALAIVSGLWTALAARAAAGPGTSA
jgi:hypothetical protein